MAKVNKYWNENGTPVKLLKTDKGYDKFIADNDQLTAEKEITKAQYDALVADQASAQKVKKRKGEMMRGDFIDAIMSQMNQDRLDGKAMVQPMDDALGAWLQIPKDSE